MLQPSSRPRPSSLAALLGLLALTLSMALAGTARAQAGDDDPEVMAQAKEHYKAGLAAYNAGKYDVAIRELKKAYLLKRLPPLLLNIGATYRKSGDIDLSLHFYQKYLDEAPSDAKDRSDVETIIAELKTQKAGADAESMAKGNDEAAPATPRRGAVEWNHNIIEAAPPETPIDVRVTAPAMKGVKVFVYYRGSGQAEFNSVLMKRRGQEKVGRIPGDAVTGTSLQYYIQAKDAGGAVVKSNGDPANPNIIMIEEGVKPVMLASMTRTDDDAEEKTEEETSRPKHRSNSDLDDEAAPSSGADLETKRVHHKKASSGGGMSTLMKVGIGVAVTGAVFAAAGGGLLGAAHSTANGLASDSKNAASQTIYWNNDPNFHGTQESQLASRGKTENAAGGALLGIGAVGLVAGVGCIIADVVTHGSSSSTDKPKKTKKRTHAAESEEESSWYVSPGVGLNNVSISGGFSF